MKAAFHRFAQISIRVLGSLPCFVVFVLSIAVWIGTGRWFDWSDSWQISYMSALTILTMLVVVLQLYMSRIMDAKVDELIKASPQASNQAMLLEEGTPDELEALEREHRQKRECE